MYHNDFASTFVNECINTVYVLNVHLSHRGLQMSIAYILTRIGSCLCVL
jgi:hypothetical protein